ncbi:hypothetical protein ACP70R_002846 [Stipagrostis hirtigluma subsp. patula]
MSAIKYALHAKRDQRTRRDRMVHTPARQEPGEQAMDSKARGKPSGEAAITVIKKQMLRCNKAGEGRFKRGYLASGGGDRGGAAIFYLACLFCTAPSSLSASR